MVAVEPVHDEAAATAVLDGRRVLLIADYHAGLELGLRYRDGVRVPSRAEERRGRLVDLIDRTDVDEVIVVGDLMHSIGGPARDERGELEAVVGAVTATVDLAVVKGNHDGDIEGWLDGVTVHAAPGIVRDGVALSHGHTWPSVEALAADVLVVGHEHPRVRLEDAVGGAADERAWLRGRIDAGYVADHLGVDPPRTDPTLVVLPAFNELSGGTRVNLPGETFLVPYLPEALREPELYLLDGTRLGTTPMRASGDDRSVDEQRP